MQKFVGNEERNVPSGSNTVTVMVFQLSWKQLHRIPLQTVVCAVISNAISLMVQLIHFIDELLFRQGWF